MRASALEFRFRVAIIFLILVLGFWAPWIEWLHLGSRTTTWLWLSFQLGALGLTSSAGIQAITLAMIAIAALGALLRVWGTAYLGASTVNNSVMKGEMIAVKGPYRFVRNPLYIGGWLLYAAIAVLMPPSGAAISMLLMTIFLFRLILAEEAFLTQKLGDPYRSYIRLVPRLFPRLRLGGLRPGASPAIARDAAKPAWLRACIAEINPIGIVLSFAVLSWRYNANILIRALLISFGISLVARALLLNNHEPAPA